MEAVSGEAISLLSDDEPLPVEVCNLDGQSPIFLVCEHAGRRIPRKLGDMGLCEKDRRRHIAWDIGAEAVCRHLVERLDAPLISQTYSRLVCDCNREIQAPSFIPEISERTRIPANENLTPAERDARIEEIYRPLHDRIKDELDQRVAAGRPTVFISMHSFTPVFMDEARPMHLGLLYDRDPRVGHLVGSVLRADGDLVIADNEPYALDWSRDYTVPEHGERRGIPSLEIEIRQDLISDPEGQAAWAERLAPALARSADHLLGEIG
ncbi:MAG: N-formylglutamate amidohydrolase [Alphaproteobacteria bacterium]|nr:N-formylglutamate amidohydrolase [Alphaproteobacteria bacterium]